VLLPDHADPALYYILPSRPRLAVDDAGEPDFSLVQYLGEANGGVRAGAFLTLATELSVPGETLNRLAVELRHSEQSGGAELRGARPRLVPVPFDGGSVELIALGESSAPPGDDAPSRIRFLGSGKPSLGADNRAAFQLLLEAFEAELVERALESADLPVIVVYHMHFTALRPSFHVKVQADWRRVYRSLANMANVNAYYVAADAESMVRRALEESGIDVDTTVFGTGDEARQGAESARRQLVDWVLERFFAPISDPKVTKEQQIAATVSGAVDDVLWSLTRTLIPGARYRLRHMDEEQLRFLSANVNETVAERREVTPQGTIGDLFERLRLDDQGKVRPDWPMRKERLVTRVDIGGFPRLEVELSVETGRFQPDGLSQVIVEVARSLTPAGEPVDVRAFVFRGETERQTYAANLLGVAPSERFQPYWYRVEVHFDPAGPFGARPPVRSEWRSARAARLVVEPRMLYTVREVEVHVSPLFSFSQFPAVTVELRVAEAGAPSRESRIVLTSDRPSGLWRFPAQGATAPYEYRLTYHREPAAGGNIVTPWRTGADSWLTVPDPLPMKRTLNIFPVLPWDRILYGFVQIRYRDDENGVRFEEQIDLSPSAPFIRRDYPIAEQGHRRLSYRLTLLLTNGELLEGSWRETEDERLVLDEGLVRRRLVRVQWIGGTLEQHRLSEVRITLEALDPGGGPPRAQAEIRVRPHNQRDAAPSFEYLLGDPPATRVRCRALFIDLNGFTYWTPWKETEGDLIVVHLGTRSVTG